MSLKIVRNDITKMNTQAIVNTAGETAEVGAGCETAIYKAAGYNKLLKAREQFGYVEEGEVFITPGFDLKAEYIIHAVSPYFINGEYGETKKLRSCYRKSLLLAKDRNIKSIAFPLIATGSYGFPRALGLRIAMDEINSFLLSYDIEVYLVVFDSTSTELAEKLDPQIQAFINHDYVCEKRLEEYGDPHFASVAPGDEAYVAYSQRAKELDERLSKNRKDSTINSDYVGKAVSNNEFDDSAIFSEDHAGEIEERVKHLKDPFGVYLLYLSDRNDISLTVLENTAWISKHVVHKIRKNPQIYRPDKRTAFQLSVGLELGLDDTKDLLARAGYAISESILEDRIWEFYIENEHFDIIDISDTLEKYGLKPIVDF